MIGITLGDPGGIGPEVVKKALDTLQLSVPVTCFGPQGDIQTGDFPITLGAPSAGNGHHAYQAIALAVKWVQSDPGRVLVTAPISKTSMAMAGAPAFDHTTLLAQLTGTENVRMGFYSPTLSTVLHSIHIPLAKVPDTLTAESLALTATRAFQFAKDLGINAPRMSLAGLNPHAGEGGLMGDEERQILTPFVAAWNQAHPECLISGPYPPDTLYHRAHKGEFDMVISLYHDQGLIPLKLIAFDRAVNVTLGLPFVRTSPDHGTAFEIAGQDKANPSAMIAAIETALRLSYARR